MAGNACAEAHQETGVRPVRLSRSPPGQGIGDIHKAVRHVRGGGALLIG